MNGADPAHPPSAAVHSSHMHEPRSHSRHVRFLLSAALLLALGVPASAQTDYYNTDTGRPLRIEDAYATERYALDLHLAPLTVKRRGGAYEWSIDPEIAYGLVPRTQVEIGVPLEYRGPAGDRQFGVAGLDVTALHNFNAETRSFPAFGLRAGILLPVGGFSPENPHPSLQGMVTRTYRWARFHANMEYTWGAEPVSSEAGDELMRWTTGVAIDRTFPLKSFLLSAEVYASQPVAEAERAAWTLGGGIRYQLTPYYSLDAGVAARVTGSEQGWSLTFGIARVLGVRVLPPGFGRWGRR